ncbi:hypothetical protein C8R46DRAFT_1119012 [Mycena filopes]|nr:hypothetical protein C8R46DRAFT_1119012 [Mycena filopes]
MIRRYRERPASTVALPTTGYKTAAAKVLSRKSPPNATMISLYRASIPSMIKSLGNLRGILTKAEEHCTTKGTSPEELIQFRLIEDMRPLDYQVYSCCNTAKFLASRVGGAPDVFFADDEKTFAELQTRVDRTVDILKALPENCMDGKEDAEIVMEKQGFRFTGVRYVTELAVPNFHFHLSSAYCIVRHLGVPVGAMDYLDSQKDLFVKPEPAAEEAKA